MSNLAERWQVGMGELKIGADDDQLRAVLGSCVGIGFLWKKGGCCGLAHCLLPEAPEPLADIGARYVSQAVPSLLRAMGACQADYADITVILAGGASMFQTNSEHLQIGRRNVEAAQKYLRQCGLNVCVSELGGHCGRQMLIDCADQSYCITPISTLERA